CHVLRRAGRPIRVEGVRRFFRAAGMTRVADLSSANALNLSSVRTTKCFPSPRSPSAIQIVRPLESIADTQPQLRATPSRKLMKSRKDNNDIENEAGHSEHDQSLVTRFASRQRPDEKARPEECMKCEIGRARQLAVEPRQFCRYLPK